MKQNPNKNIKQKQPKTIQTRIVNNEPLMKEIEAFINFIKSRKTTPYDTLLILNTITETMTYEQNVRSTQNEKTSLIEFLQQLSNKKNIQAISITDKNNRKRHKRHYNKKHYSKRYNKHARQHKNQ